VLAAGLIDGQIGLDSFTDESVLRPDIQELMRLVEVRESEIPPFGGDEFFFSYVTIEIESGGEIFRERVDIPKGDARSPLSDAEIDEKFINCLTFSESGWNPTALLRELREVASVSSIEGLKEMVERDSGSSPVGGATNVE
jgi:2-methylcitrate dehydratase PrpD